MKNLMVAVAFLFSIQSMAGQGTEVDCNIGTTSGLADDLIADWYLIQAQASAVRIKVSPSSDIFSPETYSIKVEATDAKGKVLKSKELERVQVTKLNDSMAISYAGRSLIHPPFLLIVETSSNTSEGRLKFHDFYYGNRIGFAFSCAINHI